MGKNVCWAEVISECNIGFKEEERRDYMWKHNTIPHCFVQSINSTFKAFPFFFVLRCFSSCVNCDNKQITFYLHSAECISFEISNSSHLLVHALDSISALLCGKNIAFDVAEEKFREENSLLLHDVFTLCMLLYPSSGNLLLHFENITFLRRVFILFLAILSIFLTICFIMLSCRKLFRAWRW